MTGVPSRLPIAALLVVAASASAARAGDGALPLKLAPGDHLVYERRTLITQVGSERVFRRIVDEVQLFCLARQADTCSVLLDLSRRVDEHEAGRYGVLLALDDCGRQKPLDAQSPVGVEALEALDVLPPPRDPLAAANEWYTPRSALGCSVRVSAVAGDAGEGRRFRFETDDGEGLFAAAGLAVAGDVWLDPRDGTVLRLEQRRNVPAEGAVAQSVAVLRMRRTRDERWAIRRAAEMSRYQQAWRGERQLLIELTEKPEAAERVIERLQRLWESFAADVESGIGSPFEPLAAAERRRVAEKAGALRERAKLARRWIGKPARPWALENERGESIRSDDVRRGVVVEWFWRSDLAPGLDAPRTLRLLQAGLNAKSIGLVCCNLDKDAVAAGRMLEKLASGLTNVLAAPLRDAEGLDDLPAVRVVDDVGVVRRVWVSVTPTLDELLAAVVK